MYLYKIKYWITYLHGAIEEGYIVKINIFLFKQSFLHVQYMCTYV